MELVYLCVMDNLNELIKIEEFHFSDEFICKYESNKLVIKRNTTYFPGFFKEKSDDPIVNITAIIGGNGSGKTSLIETIVKSIKNPSRKNILVFKKENSLVINSDIEVKGEGVQVNRVSFFEDLPELYYYTNCYSGEPSKFRKVVTDLSIDNLAGKNFLGRSNIDHLRFVFNKQGERILEKLELLFHKKNKLKINMEIVEIKKYLNAKYEKEKNYFEKLELKKDEFGDEHIENIFKDLLQKYNETVNHKELNKNKKENIPHELEEIIKMIIYYNLFIHYYVFFCYENVFYNSDSFSQFHNNFEISIGNKDLSEKIVLLKNIITGKSLYSNESIRRTNYEEYFTENKKRIEVIDSYFETIKFHHILPIDRHDHDEVLPNNRLDFVIDILNSKNEKYNISDFLNQIEILRDFDQNSFYFKWVGMSYGEKAMVDLFSRFYPFMREGKKNKLIFIDEGELGFHPEWQRKYIKLLVDYFNSFDGNQIQIIITSHSPIVISDLPKKNIVFRSKEGDKSAPDISETFAQNIHTILYDSFFLKEGTIGEFAKEFIVKLFREIEYLTLKNKEAVWKKIQIIGEPIIKKKFEQEYLLRINKIEESNVDYKIEELKAEIKRLEKMKAEKSGEIK